MAVLAFRSFDYPRTCLWKFYNHTHYRSNPPATNEQSNQLKAYEIFKTFSGNFSVSFKKEALRRIIITNLFIITRWIALKLYYQQVVNQLEIILNDQLPENTGIADRLNTELSCSKHIHPETNPLDQV